MMNNIENGKNAASAEKKEAAKKEENWKEICKDCEVLKLDMDCGFGCEMIKGSNKNKKN